MTKYYCVPDFVWCCWGWNVWRRYVQAIDLYVTNIYDASYFPYLYELLLLNLVYLKGHVDVRNYRVQVEL